MRLELFNSPQTKSSNNKKYFNQFFNVNVSVAFQKNMEASRNYS